MPKSNGYNQEDDEEEEEDSTEISFETVPKIYYIHNNINQK